MGTSTRQYGSARQGKGCSRHGICDGRCLGVEERARVVREQDAIIK